MDQEVRLEGIYAPSKAIVAREIQGVMVIVPIAAGIVDMEDELYSLNETGKAIWHKLDGRRTLNQVVEELTAEYHAPQVQVQADVLGLVAELVKRKMLISVENG